MDFSLHDDHLALRDAVQRFCDDQYPAERRGDAETPQQSRERHQALAALGLLGLPLPEAVGGSAQGPLEVMLAAQALGSALGGGTFLSSTVMAAQLIARLGSPEQQQQWLPALASAERQAAVAFQEDGTRYDWQRVGTRARPQGAGWVIDGHKRLVLQGDSADLLLVLARTEGDQGARQGLTVFAVDARQAGVSVQGFDTLDNRRAAHIQLTQVAVDGHHLLGIPGQAADAFEAVLDAGIAALCAECVGAVEALLAHTAEHLRTRKQFGAPLAKFQVLQHRVADMAIALEQLKSMACAAAMAVQADDPLQRRRLVSAAKVLASQTGREVGLAAIQLHGAMGMTDECRVGHYAKRLMVIGQTFGDAPWHLQRMAGGRNPHF